MKHYLTLFITIFFLATSQNIEAQFLKKLQKSVEDKIEQEAERRTQRRTDKAIDDTFDKAEDMIDGKDNNKDEESNNSNSSNNNNEEESDNSSSNNKKATNQPNVVWSKFDFVPGDEVIFEDGPSTDEENGEFPSRWDLYKGSAEIGEMNGEPVIMFLARGGMIVPYLKNSKEDYLPEIFTIELDVWFDEDNSNAHRYWIKLKDDKNQFYKTTNDNLEVYANGLQFLNTKKPYPGRENLNWNVNKVGVWRHISIAYTKGKFKAYMDDTRLINVPHLEMNPWGITIKAENDKMYIKNFRIAKGGVKYYDRVLSEGKIIVNGIRFDVNKATIKPESMGPINKIYQLMEKNPDINFSVEGHTDADGGDDTNLKLSKARGKAVMDKLIAMGISSDRLKSNGFGESKPLDNNSTPEGKANNRRVEFVKF